MVAIVYVANTISNYVFGKCIPDQDYKNTRLEIGGKQSLCYLHVDNPVSGKFGRKPIWTQEQPPTNTPHKH